MCRSWSSIGFCYRHGRNRNPWYVVIFILDSNSRLVIDNYVLEVLAIVLRAVHGHPVQKQSIVVNSLLPVARAEHQGHQFDRGLNISHVQLIQIGKKIGVAQGNLFATFPKRVESGTSNKSSLGGSQVLECFVKRCHSPLQSWFARLVRIS